MTMNIEKLRNICMYIIYLKTAKIITIKPLVLHCRTKSWFKKRCSNQSVKNTTNTINCYLKIGFGSNMKTNGPRRERQSYETDVRTDKRKVIFDREE